TPLIYTLSLHDALPIYSWLASDWSICCKVRLMPAFACSSVTPGFSRAMTCSHMYLLLTSFGGASTSRDASVSIVRGTHRSGALRSEEHTSELQSRSDLV